MEEGGMIKREVMVGWRNPIRTLPAPHFNTI